MNNMCEANGKIGNDVLDDGTAKRCYTVKELQEILSISRPTVYELLKRNEFRWIQVGSTYRISKKSFDEWLDCKMENGGF